MVKIDMSETKGDRSKWDFVNAANKVDPNWATSMRLQFITLTNEGKPLTQDIPTLIQNLQGFRRSQFLSQGKTSTAGAFQATF